MFTRLHPWEYQLRNRVVNEKRKDARSTHRRSMALDRGRECPLTAEVGRFSILVFSILVEASAD